MGDKDGAREILKEVLQKATHNRKPPRRRCSRTWIPDFTRFAAAVCRRGALLHDSNFD
jgi:hypothetical protein